MINSSTRFRATLAAAALAGAATLSAPVTAHHSTAMFEWGKEKPMPNAVVDRLRESDCNAPLADSIRSDEQVCVVQPPLGEGGAQRRQLTDMTGNLREIHRASS